MPPIASERDLSVAERLATTRGTLLDGRITYDQPLNGYRTGIEPVLLAASIPARAGHRVVEAGTGAGAGLLCLMCRVAGVHGVGIEQEPTLAALARMNADINRFTQMRVETCDVLAAEPWASAPCDHAMANPPWYGPGATASPDPLRDAAKRGRSGLLHQWAASLTSRLHMGGTLTFILRVEALAETMAGFTASGCGSLTILPLWPRHGRAARIVIVRGIRGGRGGSNIHPGLVLHGPGQGFSQEADRILRGGAALES